MDLLPNYRRFRRVRRAFCRIVVFLVCASLTLAQADVAPACEIPGVAQPAAAPAAPTCHGDVTQAPRDRGGCASMLTRQRCCCIDDTPAGIPANAPSDSACTVSTPTLPLPILDAAVADAFWGTARAVCPSGSNVAAEHVPIFIAHRALLI
jgi:hypothetical protein